MRAFRARKKEAQDAARAAAAEAFGVLPHPPPSTVVSPCTANRRLAGQKRVRDHRERQGEAGRIERRQYSQQWWDQQCTPDKKMRLAQKKHRIEQARSTESEQERRLRLEAQTQRITESRRIESEEEGRRRLDAQAERTREARRTQPNEARDIEREVNRLAHDLARRLESPNARRRRLDQDVVREQERHAQEPSEVSDARRVAHAQYMWAIHQEATNAKEEYLRAFDAHQYGSLHQQQWMLEEMKGFAKDMQDLEMKYCCKCKEYWVHNGEHRNEGFVCDDCWKQRNNMPKFSDGNNMDPGDVPSQSSGD